MLSTHWLTLPFVTLLAVVSKLIKCVELVAVGGASSLDFPAVQIMETAGLGDCSILPSVLCLNLEIVS